MKEVSGRWVCWMPLGAYQVPRIMEKYKTRVPCEGQSPTTPPTTTINTTATTTSSNDSNKLRVACVACGMSGYNTKAGTTEDEHGVRRRRGVRCGRRRERTRPCPVGIASHGGGCGEDQTEHRGEQGRDQVSALVARSLVSFKSSRYGRYTFFFYFLFTSRLLSWPFFSLPPSRKSAPG